MTLAELGARLREAREAKGMSVADVADRLKIPGRILHGVEDASDRLPRTVYVHHFIKDYAKFVGISPAEIAEWTGNLEGFEHISRPVLSESQPFTPVKPSMLPVVLGALVKLVLVAAAAFAAYSAYVYFFAGRDYEDIAKLPAQEQAAPAASAAPQAAPAWAPADTEEGASSSEKVQDSAEAPAAPVAGKAEAQSSAEPASQPVSQAPDWGAPAAQPEEEPVVTQAMPSAAEDALPASASALTAQLAPAELTGESVSASPSEAAPAAPVSVLTALPEGMHHVEVIADAGDCWMGFEADGRKQQRFLRKGDSFTLSFGEELVMKLGHASAVRVIYDGKELDRDTSGRVVNLRFPPAE
ncbi:MAG: DUF4115 domain-containing protein [Mailhella sp.]|nr:DUF4115 domain-containing protein [Mailhella sp.]